MNNNPEDGMRGIGIPGPSAALKEKVISAARAQWSASAQYEDVSWVFPVLRLAASIVIVFAALSLAGRSDKWSRVYAQFFAQSGEPRMEPVPGLDEQPVARLVPRLGRLTTGNQAESLLKRQEDILELLEETKFFEKSEGEACVRQNRDGTLS